MSPTTCTDTALTAPTMGRFRYDDNEEDEYDIDKNNNNNNNDFGWEFVANPGEEGAMVPVESNREIFEDHHLRDDDEDDDPTTVSPPSHHQQQHQQQQPTFYVVMQQDPMGIYNNIQQAGGFYEYELRTRRSKRSIYCLPTWLIMCLVAIISHIAWHAIHNGPPAPPPIPPLQPFESHGDNGAITEHDFYSSTTTHRTNSPMQAAAASSSWHDYLDKHCNMFLHSTRALFWEMPKHVITWWYRYMQDEVRQRVQDWNKVPVQYCSVSLSSSSSILNHGHERIMAQFIQQQSTSISDPLNDDDDDDHHNYSTASSLSSSSIQAGLFFAKGQPLAIRAVADALHTWRPKTFAATSSSSLSFPPLLLFASAMTPGLAMQDLGTMLSHLLIPASDCENKNHHAHHHHRVNKGQQQQQRQGLLLRPLVHLEAASDWDQDMLARQILEHVQEWSASAASTSSIHHDTAGGGGGIVVLQHVHQLAPTIFAWLVRELSTPPTPHGSSSSSSSSYSSSSQLYMHCQNVIFLFTSDMIGKSSIVRSIRQVATSTAQAAIMANKPSLMPVNNDDDEYHDSNSSINSNNRIGRLRRPMDLVEDISRPSLTLDIQHEMQLHFGAASIGTSMHAILPFLPYTQLDLADIVTLAMEQYWQEESCRYCHSKQDQHKQRRWSRLVTTRAAVQALVHEHNVEYIVWKTVINHGSSSSNKSQNKGTKRTTTGAGGGEVSSVGPPSRLPVVLLTFSSTGADPVQRYLLSLQVHLERCLQKVVNDGNDINDNRNAQQQQQQQQESQSSSSKILVLDSSDDTGKRGILKECQQNSNDVIIDGLMPPTSVCTEICSFPLV